MSLPREGNVLFSLPHPLCFASTMPFGGVTHAEQPQSAGGRAGSVEQWPSEEKRDLGGISWSVGQCQLVRTSER